jgi:uncharacterized protein (TIGR02300 family)
VAKPEWGTKRICQSCSAPFYDLRRDPIVCPKCEAVFDPEAILKSRKIKGAEEPPKPVKEEVKDPEDILEVEADKEVVADGADDTVLEDTSDLGDEDVSEVIETSKDKDET